LKKKKIFLEIKTEHKKEIETLNEKVENLSNEKENKIETAQLHNCNFKEKENKLLYNYYYQMKGDNYECINNE
jgi:hypothetical protein